MYAEDLAVVFPPVLDWEVVEITVEQLDASITRCCKELILVDFGPG